MVTLDGSIRDDPDDPRKNSLKLLEPNRVSNSNPKI